MKKFKPFTVIFIASLLLFGCSNKTEDKAEEILNNTGTNPPQEDTGSNGVISKENDNQERKVTEDIDNNVAQPGDNDQKMEVADEAADRITKLDNVESATVIVTNQSAYVAAMLKDTTDGEGTDELERQISDEVKATNNDLQSVYVSVNPDFADRMVGYGNKIKNGEPIVGFFDEFTETVKRIFPEAR